MYEFIAKHQDKIIGTLSGFDRLVFRRTLRSIAHDVGMMRYLWANQVLLKDFAAHVEQVSRRLKEASLAEAQSLGRPAQYLTSSQLSKGEIVRGIAAKAGIRDGLVCVLSCVEPGWSFEIHRNRATHKLESQLLAAPRVRVHERPDPDLVSLPGPDLPEWPGMAGAAVGRGRPGLTN